MKPSQNFDSLMVRPVKIGSRALEERFCIGGIFVDNSVPPSIFDSIVSRTTDSSDSHFSFKLPAFKDGLFLCVGLSINGDNKLTGNPGISLRQNGDFTLSRAQTVVPKGVGNAGEEDKKYEVKPGGRGRGRGAVNTTKHLWAGAVAAMVARTFLAPLERLKLEYMLHAEEKELFELIKAIAATQGLTGFWKGNLVNILRTAPFKAVNFCAYDTYRKQLLRFRGDEETTNAERFIAGAAAGITATVLCLPLDTIRTKMVAPGGEALGGVIGAFRHVIQTEGFLSLYNGLVPSILSIAPSAAVFYGVYDILKSAYLHSAKGRKRIENLQRHGGGLNAFDQLELGPVRTLLHGAISGACAEAATYPFEVVRRQLQLQGRSNKVGALTTFARIVERGGVPALYAGLVPSLLQVLPSAAISYFVYEFMKIILKVE
ncbi:OLC1v1017423C1 [Oldenlandia corymbosa var. corymbosa]|uniref:OLC1v1017423C1 n=1 Tax=Oldenlandia corymbosa var. corymbosa TaxID=529605 RepID=A0AAV1E9E4_OLDCO|nr:OLC1v1017423C1 [Oldenlandia corymbosa var. corymbosa]